MSKLVAVAYGISGFAGRDNELGVDDLSIPVEEATSLSEVNRRWTKSRMEAYDCGFEDLNEKISGDWPIGFWVLERENFETAMVPKTVGLQRSDLHRSDLHWFTNTIDQSVLELLSRLKISHLGADPKAAKELSKSSKDDLIRQILGVTNCR